VDGTGRAAAVSLLGISVGAGDFRGWGAGVDSEYLAGAAGTIVDWVVADAGGIAVLSDVEEEGGRGRRSNGAGFVVGGVGRVEGGGRQAEAYATLGLKLMPLASGTISPRRGAAMLRPYEETRQTKGKSGIDCGLRNIELGGTQAEAYATVG